MGELEDQIARLAHHRAEQVPPYRAPASLDRARGRHRAAWFVAAAAVLTAIAVAAGVLVWDGGDGPSVRTGPTPATEVPAPSTVPPTPPPTTPPTTVPAAKPCPAEPVDTNPMSGGPTNRVADSALVNVQLQTSTCVDEVAFQFRGTPDWSVEYASGPVMLEPQGEPVTMEGNAFLVVRFDHADAGRTGYDGPKRLVAGPLSHVTEIRQTQDFEAVLTWVIGLDAQLPFAVDDRTHDGRTVLVVRFPEFGPERAVTCSDPARHLEFDVPTGWYVALGDEFACGVLAPFPFEIVRNSDAGVPVGIGTMPNARLAESLTDPDVASSTSTPVIVDGHAGTCAEGEYGSGIFSGTRFFRCEVPWGDAGFLTAGANGALDPQFTEFKAGVQALLASARYLP